MKRRYIKCMDLFTATATAAAATTTTTTHTTTTTTTTYYYYYDYYYFRFLFSRSISRKQESEVEKHCLQYGFIECWDLVFENRVTEGQPENARLQISLENTENNKIIETKLMSKREVIEKALKWVIN